MQRLCGRGTHLFVAQVSQVEGEPGQLVALADVEHRDGVTSIHQRLHQVSAQKSRASDHGAPFVTLNHTHAVIYTPGTLPRSENALNSPVELAWPWCVQNNRVVRETIRYNFGKFCKCGELLETRIIRKRLCSLRVEVNHTRALLDRDQLSEIWNLIGPSAAGWKVTVHDNQSAPMYVKERDNCSQSCIWGEKNTPSEYIRPIHWAAIVILVKKNI